jgi:hypothetical protein
MPVVIIAGEEDRLIDNDESAEPRVGKAARHEHWKQGRTALPPRAYGTPCLTIRFR